MPDLIGIVNFGGLPRSRIWGISPRNLRIPDLMRNRGRISPRNLRILYLWGSRGRISPQNGHLLRNWGIRRFPIHDSQLLVQFSFPKSSNSLAQKLFVILGRFIFCIMMTVCIFWAAAIKHFNFAAKFWIKFSIFSANIFKFGF